MNCLRISPGTSRKPGAMRRKCAAQAARSMCGGSLYWTMAVIIVRISSAARAVRARAWSRSSSHLAGLKDMDGLGQLPGAPGAAAELTQNPPGLELGIGALARRAEPVMGPVGLLLQSGLVPAPVRGADILLADVPLIAQRDQPASGQFADDAPDPGRSQVVHRAGQRPGHPHDVPVRDGDDLKVHS